MLKELIFGKSFGSSTKSGGQRCQKPYHGIILRLHLRELYECSLRYRHKKYIYFRLSSLKFQPSALFHRMIPAWVTTVRQCLWRSVMVVHENFDLVSYQILSF